MDFCIRTVGWALVALGMVLGIAGGIVNATPATTWDSNTIGIFVACYVFFAIFVGAGGLLIWWKSSPEQRANLKNTLGLKSDNDSQKKGLAASFSDAFDSVKYTGARIV